MRLVCQHPIQVDLGKRQITDEPASAVRQVKLAHFVGCQ